MTVTPLTVCVYCGYPMPGRHGARCKSPAVAPEPVNRNGYPLADDLRETMASALGLDVDEGWFAIATLLWEQVVLDGCEPRTWSLPAEPGPEVTAVRDASGECWTLYDDGWWRVAQIRRRWGSLLAEFGPLTDATGEEQR